ncbi:LysR family transcriptional regulator [Mameliella alba]|nr:LysR family transcriptional regulator [Antarctobacter heliothermus]MBY6145176.1 LysR family transcriptional regulator [Mameliella alba]
MMDTRQLRYFTEIVSQGSISRAAGVLNIAQPALSQAVRTLEERLGTQLLTRSHAGVAPTEAGALLARRARRILDDLARTEDDLRNLEQDPSGEVRIGLPGTISGIVALPLITAARARYPRISITVAEAMSGFIAEWLAEGRVDLALLYSAGNKRGAVAEPLLEEELAVLFGAGVAAPAEMPLTELRDRPLVLPSPAHGLRSQIDAAMQELGFAPQVAVEIDSYINIKRLVAAGFGASILPLHAVRDEGAQGSLTVCRLAAPGLWRGVDLLSPTDRPVSRAQEAVRDLLREVVADLLREGRWYGARPPVRGPVHVRR